MHDEIRVIFKEGDESLSDGSSRTEHADFNLFIAGDCVHEKQG